MAGAARVHPQLTIEETGDVSANQARNRTVDRDLHRAELLSIPLTLLVLLFAFGALTAALVPVLLALSAVAAGLGLLGPLSQLFPVEDSAKTVVLLIGMAVGVDYALFFVVRSRAERSRGVAISEALETTLRTSGRTVIVSGATVAIAMAGMYLVGVRTLSGIATAAIAVIACAVLGAVTVLPATLRLLGPRIDRGRIPLLPRARTDGSRFWSALVDQRSPPTAHRRRARNSAPRCTRVPRAGAPHLGAERPRADRSGRAGAEGARRCPPSLPQRRRDRHRRQSRRRQQRRSNSGSSCIASADSPCAKGSRTNLSIRSEPSPPAPAARPRSSCR